MEKKIISCIRYNMDFERATPVKRDLCCFSNFVIPLQVISKDFIFGCCVVVEFIQFEFRNSSVV
jgi:hypothetical protein